MGLLDKTATLTAGQDPGDTSTSGLGGLILRSDLYNKALAQANNNKLENFDSFVVTNPDLVDPGIDVSGLRTTTDTSPYLLGNIPDYGGIQYEAYNPNRLSDLMRLYSGGFPMLDTPQAAPDFTGGQMIDTGGGGGMDQATSGLNLGDTTITGGTNLNDYEGMGDMTGGVTNDNITVENIAQNQTPYDVPMPMNDPGASIENIIAQQNQTIPYDPSINAFDINEVGDPALNPGSINVGDQPMAAGPFDYLQNQGIGGVQVPGLDYSQADIDAERLGSYTPSSGTVNELTDDPTMQETISNAFTSARQGIGDLAGAGVDKIQEVGQSIANTIGGIYNGEDQTISVFGREINVPATLGGIALNQIVGAPISLAFGALKAIGGMLPKDSLANSTTRSIAAQLTAENDYDGYNMQSGNIGQDPFGRNPVSTFGDYEATLINDINNPSDTKMGNAKKNYAKDYFNAKAEVAGGVDMGDGTVLGPGEAPGDVVSLEDLLKSQPVTVEKISPGSSPDDDDPADEEPIGNQGSTVNTNTGDITDSSGNYAGNIMDESGAPAPAAPAPAPAPNYGPYSGGGGGGGGGGSGGGGGGSPGSSGPGGSDAMGSFKKGGLAGLKRYAK